MTGLREITSSGELVFGKIVDPESNQALLPVVVVDALALAADGLAAIRMQGWANKDAVDVTLEERLVTFYSRSQRALWTKGQQSGNALNLRAAYTDCDNDCLLIDAEPTGPTCHTGALSCFEEELGPESVKDKKMTTFDATGLLASTRTIEQRAAGLAEGKIPESYTEKLIASQNELVKKVSSEAGELIREICRPDFDEERFVGEAADVIFSLEVACAAKAVPIVAVFNELANRNKKKL